MVQHPFQPLEFVLLDGAFRQQDDIDTSDLFSGREEHPVDEVKVESLLRCEFEEAERLLGKPLDRALYGPEVRLFYPQWPRQQQQLSVFGLGVGTATTSRQLVPVGLQARSVDAGVT
jgi:hypothetical protein